MSISTNQYLDDRRPLYRSGVPYDLIIARRDRRIPHARTAREISPDYVPEILRQKLAKALLEKSSNFVAHFRRIDELSNDRISLQGCVEPPSVEALARAREILRQFEIENIVPTRIVASIEGGVAICFVAGDIYADVECLNSGGILAVTSNRRNRPNVWEIDASPIGIARSVAQIKDFYVGTTAANDAQRQTD
jgi:hypothetical protein